MQNLTDNPMQPANLAKAPRCGARTKSGASCRSPAVKDRLRCRMHGGTNRGAPKNNRNAWKHGNRSAEAEEQLKAVRAADRVLRSVGKLLRGQALRPSERDRLIDLHTDGGLLSEGASGTPRE